MSELRIKGHSIRPARVKDSYYRRATQYKNKILESLRKFGLSEDDSEIEVERGAMKKLPATATWWMEGFRLHYSYDRGNNYAENMFIVAKVIENEVNAVESGEKTMAQFCRDFSEEDDVADDRREARLTLGLDETEKDWAVIHKAYKKLSMKHHPDMPDGDHDMFQEVNKAHKVLKRELE